MESDYRGLNNVLIAQAFKYCFNPILLHIMNFNYCPCPAYSNIKYHIKYQAL